MVFKNGLKNIQAKPYNGAHMVYEENEDPFIDFLSCPLVLLKRYVIALSFNTQPEIQTWNELQ